MNHEQIDQLDLIDRYLMGKLPAEVSSSFEEHFVDCPQCIARLQTTKNFMQGLRLVAAEQAAQIDPQSSGRSVRPYVTSLFQKPLAWAAALLLIAAAAGAVFVIDYMRGLREEVDQAKSLSEQWQRRYEDERQSAMAAERNHREVEAQHADQLRELEAKLKQQQPQRAEMADEPARRLPPEGSLPIYTLTSVRGGEPRPEQGANEIHLRRSATLFALLIPLEGETRYESYRIRILDERQRLIRQFVDLLPGRQGALSVWLRSDLFQPGRYSLIAEGENKEGASNPIGNYPFLIVKDP
ncbi:MAG TPA: hypothetical protein VNO14_13950 [Blastocatellia bacterium]|nr:hypothetical protein [Blastocatellia bacterium]